jgi:dipeptidyl aminopeptidase/acylaminoacyl peptidase
MESDLRQTDLYRETEELYRALRKPGTGQISDATEVHSSPDGRYAVVSAAIVEKLEGIPPTRICLIDILTGDTQVLTFGPNNDRLPRFSPSGRHIAFLSDRNKASDFQLYLLDPRERTTSAGPVVEGWVEYLDWSPDGKRILLGVAEYGADIAGAQGATSTKQATQNQPCWAPTVQAGDYSCGWRSVWVYDLASDKIHRVSATDINIWEATWSGNHAIATVASPGPGEGLWYSARLTLIDLRSGEARELYRPSNQLGWPTGSPSGQHVAIVEALCSDRGIVAGDMLLIETSSGRVQRVDTHRVDISYIEWRSDQALLVAGHRGLDTVFGTANLTSGRFQETWVSQDVTTGGRHASVSGLDDLGNCVFAAEGFTLAPELAIVRNGKYKCVRSFDLGYARAAKVIDRVDAMRWDAPDGLEIQGWLLLPKGEAPHPVVVMIHGGPVWHFRPFWLGRYAVALLLLISLGYAIFLPNPRGSTGRGQEFVRLEVGDLGGMETFDHLSGIDHLVKLGIADPTRLGVTGGSHGGYMTSWLIGQDMRFAAAVSVAPVTNWVSEHLVSNIPHFCMLALNDRYINPSGKYFMRSPIMHAHKVKTPTLNICGALDRCTPPEEARQFHNALLESGVKSVLVTYPEEGHGVRNFPAVIDYASRVVRWFQEQMPP